jgi:hypothetical protein
MSSELSKQALVGHVSTAFTMYLAHKVLGLTQSSRLLKLPGEIRNKIYEHAFTVPNDLDLILSIARRTQPQGKIYFHAYSWEETSISQN